MGRRRFDRCRRATLNLSASGFGGSWDGESTPTAAQGGEGFGGNVTLYNYGPGTITLGGNTNLVADGTGGDGQTGGAGHGGTAGITVYDGTIALGPSTYVSGSGWGGDASFGLGGAGGDAFGGGAFIEVLSSTGEVPTSGTLTGGDLTVAATASGGAGGAGDGANIAPGAGGNADGGLGCGECGTSAATIIVDGTATLSLGIGRGHC